MYRAFVQMPLALYDDKTAVVEAEIELADEYVPMRGQWLSHPIFKGLMPLGPIVYDGARKAVVLTTLGVTYDFTVTLDEWLEGRPGWKPAEHSFIEVGRKRPDDKDEIEDDD